MLDDLISTLKDDLYNRPSPSLIFAARWIMDSFPRILLPDWVSALANGNLENWEAVLEVARNDDSMDEAQS